MTHRICIAVFLLIPALAACNLPAEQPVETTSPPTETQPTLVTPTASIRTFTPVPIESLLTFDPPTITPTATPGTVLASPRDQPVNCRFGPGTSYGVAGALNPGRQAEVIGRNADSSWWYVRNPSNPSTSCWIAASVTDAAGNVEALQVVNPPEIVVTRVDVEIDPPAMHVACSAFPQTVVIRAEITTSGPAIVTWRWESSAGTASAEKNLLFEEGGTKVVEDFHQVDLADDYSVQVRTLLPNVSIGSANFRVTCVP